MGKHKTILLTGGSGQLGQAILKSGTSYYFLTPERNALDITSMSSIERYFQNHSFNALIHCAAITSMAECERDPIKAIETNIIGTSNLVKAVMSKENMLKIHIRFVHISTDGVYAGLRGNYSEKDETIPYNRYGWTKLGSECAVNLLKNFCIIRTSFFNPNKIEFDSYAVDRYSSKVSIDYLATSILTLLESTFTGTINIGGRRRSDYMIFSKFKRSLKRCKRSDILEKTGFSIAKDASLNSKRWNKIRKNIFKDTHERA